MEHIESEVDEIETALGRAAPLVDRVEADHVLARVLEGVLDDPVEPVRAGRYAILEPLGTGGLGTVYAAYDSELDRRVAIKLVRAEAAARCGRHELQQRLRREAQALAQLNHPNVVAIHDVGLFRDQVFIAMELVEGQTLQEWLREAPRTWQEIRDVFVRAGRGLAAVHGAGLVQRDFKPQNVIVGNDLCVKLLDFGLARVGGSRVAPAHADLTGQRSLLDTAVTRADHVVGTPRYMAPEQWKGEAPDARVDQFAFCVALYEALFGVPPFAGDTPAARLGAIRSGRLVDPLDRRRVPSWLRSEIVRGLAPTPHDRHPSMGALIEALLRDHRRRRRSGWGVGVAAGVSAIVTALVMWLAQPEITQADRDAIARLAAEARDAAERRHFVYPPLHDPNQPTAYARMLELERLEGPAHQLAAVEADTLREQLSEVLMRYAEAYEARPGGAEFAADFYAAAALFDADNQRALERSYLTDAQLSAIRVRLERGEYSDAELVAGESMIALAANDEDERREKVAALRALGDPRSDRAVGRLEMLVGGGDLARVEAPAVAAPTSEAKSDATPVPAPGLVSASRPAEATDHEGATELARRGLRALRQRRLDEAETLLHRAVAQDRHNVTALAGFATLYFELGKYPRALEYARRAVNVAPRNAGLRMELGHAYLKVLRYDDALAAYRKAKALGHADADEAIARVEAKLGRR